MNGIIMASWMTFIHFRLIGEPALEVISDEGVS